MSSIILHASARLALALTLLLFAAATAPDPTWLPSLTFNWTLATTDCPVALHGWVPRGPGPGATMDRDVSGSFASASLNVEFIGEGVAIKGTSSAWGPTNSGPGSVTNADDPTFNPSYQPITAPSRSDVLWERHMPRFKEYAISLNAVVGDWTVESVEIMMGIQSDAPDLASVPTRTEQLLENGALNYFFTFSGRWTANDEGTLVCYDDAQLAAPVPPGTAFVVINGTRSPSARSFAVKLKGPSFADDLYSILDAEYGYTLDNVLMYMAPINPDLQYHLTFDCVTSSQGENGVRSVTFYEGT